MIYSPYHVWACPQSVPYLGVYCSEAGHKSRHMLGEKLRGVSVYQFFRMTCSRISSDQISRTHALGTHRSAWPLANHRCKVSIEEQFLSSHFSLSIFFSFHITIGSEDQLNSNIGCTCFWLINSLPIISHSHNV